ncbi:MAG: hypothetical protein JXX14_13560 [Deltaproteobacteria bacterium]|nr:hypothetical protein [Deltaproteobacteria bacterium]
MMQQVILTGFVLMSLVVVGPVSAQNTELVSQPTPPGETSASGQTTIDEKSVPTPLDSQSVAARLEALTAALRAQKNETDALKQKAVVQDRELEKLSNELSVMSEEHEQISLSQLEAEALDTVKRFSVYGFMDVQFTAAFPQQKNGSPDWSSPIFIETQRRSTFHQAGVNLYFKSELTSTLETLVETQFTYQPNGDISSYPKVVHSNGGGTIEAGEWVRTSTSVRKPYSGDLRLGGVWIERAQIDWKPRDWLNIRMGRFLSPFGIWHEDHGSPVRLTTHEPFIISNNYLPNAQTGIMVLGKIFAGNNADFDYAVTLSNGRGPADEYVDLDSNKALGLRARVNITLRDFSVSAGAYGYMGQYTDNRNALHVYTNATNSGFDPTVEQPTQWIETVTSKYDEKILATDLQINFKGIQLFGEYVRGQKKYIVPTEIFAVTPLFVGASPDVDAIEPNQISQAWYGVAAYQLPFTKALKDIKITPFVGFDHLEPSDVYSYDSVSLFLGGINVKPSPYVTIKTGAYCIIPKDKTVLGDNTWFWDSQIAVSF